MKRIFLFIINTFILLLLLMSCTQTCEQKQWSDQEAMIKAMEWQEAHPIFALAPTDWTNGAYYIGVTKAFEATDDPIYLTAMKDFGYKNKWEPCYRVHHADDIAISYSYIVTSQTRKNLVDLTPTKEWIDEHLYQSHDWIDYENPQSMRNTLWWWCDALFMAPPVITLYAKQTGDNSYLDTMHKFYMETYTNLFDKDENLFARDSRYKWTGSDKDLKENNGQKVFWSRGNGWVLGGLAIMLQDMPKNYKNRGFYEDLFIKLATRIQEIQPEDGLWRVSLLDPDAYNHGEVSGSGFYTYAMAWGINNGLLDEAVFKPTVTKAWDALRKCQHDDGMVGWVQNIGDSPKPASIDSWQNYGTGAFLLAGSEMIKMNK